MKLYYTIRNISSLRRKCKNDPDNFCYICGHYTPPVHRRKFTPKVKIAYKFYIGYEVGDQDQKCSPHICRNACYTRLLQWLAGKKKKMPFDVPMTWRKQADHFMECYFFLTNINGFLRKKKLKIKYLNSRSAMKPVQHSSTVPIISLPTWCISSKCLIFSISKFK